MMTLQITNLARLRAGTRSAHALIETVPALARLLATDLTRNEYVSVLQHLHAFHAHAEPAVCQELAMWPEAAAMLDGSRPRALAEDLAWFGAKTIAPPRLPVLEGPSAALGALYVIEGSGLGGRVIARHLTASLGVSQSAGGAFFCRQDADTARRRWQTLTVLLESPIPGGEAAGVRPDEVIDGAQETFRSLECWLRTIETVAENVDFLARPEALAS